MRIPIVKGYTRDTWEANGGTVWLRASAGTISIFDMRIITARWKSPTK